MLFCYVLREKLLNILLDSNIDNYQYFEAEVIHRRKHYTYYLFFIYGDNYDWVDYKNMKFWGESNRPYGDFYRQPHEQVGTQKKEIKVEVPEQFINWQKLYPDYPNRQYENLKLNHSNIHHDMIRIPSLIGNDYLVSESLKDKILQAGCTGIEFKSKDLKEQDIL